MLTYARSDDLRRRVRAEFDNRAYPGNMAVLDRMIARRAELARLLGFASWADYAVADKMVGYRRQRLGVHRPGRGRLGRRGGAGVPDAAPPEAAGRSRRATGDQPLGDGLPARAGAALGLRLRLPAGAALSPLRPGEAGRPRPLGAPVRRHLPADEGRAGVAPFGRGVGDAGETASWPAASTSTCIRVRASTATRRTSGSAPAPPTARCPSRRWSATSPAARAGEPGLMDHGDVETFLHEFGHLMHSMLARQRWNGISGVPNRVGLRGGAVADAGGVELGSDGARRVRAALRDRRADPGRAGAPAQAGHRFRPRARHAHPDDLRPDLAVAVRPRRRRR